MEKIIEVEGLTKLYGKFKAVDDLSIYVEKGRIFGLLGPNGSGKSTTINCILSLLKYQKGEIKIFGETMSPGRTLSRITFLMKLLRSYFSS